MRRNPGTRQVMKIITPAGRSASLRVDGRDPGTSRRNTAMRIAPPRMAPQ
jgi:hypothetical protein